MSPFSQSKVVHVIGALVAGGAERFVVSLLRNLKANGVDVSLWTLSNRTDGVGEEMRSSLAAAGINCECGPTHRVGLSTINWYVRLLHRDKPRALHLHTPNTEVAHHLADCFPLPELFLYRTIHNTCLPESGLALRAYKKNRMHCSIACGDAAKAQYKDFLSGKLVAISNGVDFDFPIRDTVTVFNAKRRLGLDLHAYHFLSVGRMEGGDLRSAQKAHDVMLKAWSRSALGQASCQLHLLGDGLLRKALEALATGDASVRFHGVRQDVHDWLLAADCFLMPSRFEGLPMAGIEAIGAGLPCVFSDIAPLRELNPPLALWACVDDPQSLSDQLVKMVGKRTAPDKDSVVQFRHRYSIQRAADSYRQIYEADQYRRETQHKM